MTEKLTPLSASRLKLFESCSFSYFCNYILKLPDKGNSGSLKGSVSHTVLECLAIDRRKDKVKKILKKKDPFCIPSVERLVRQFLRKHNLEDDEQLEMVRTFVLHGLSYDFYGTKRGKPDQALTEEAFDIEVKNEDLLYRVRGFIDRLFIYGDRALIRDYKSSKETYQGKDLNENLQAIIYCLAVLKLFPQIEHLEVEFLFLKFDLNEESEWESKDYRGGQTKKQYHNGGGRITLKFEKAEVLGFQWELSAKQRSIQGFGEERSTENMAASKDIPTDGTFSGKLMCGFATYKGQLKKDGCAMFHCQNRFPQTFVRAVNFKSGEILKTSFEDKSDELKSWISQQENKHEIFFDTFRFKGCPNFNSYD